MLTVEIPGRGSFNIENVIFDYNGTIAVNGEIKPQVRKKINELSNLVRIYVLTADTYGSAARECEGLNLKLLTFPTENARDHKAEIVSSLGENNSVCFGNGYNDLKMFQKALLSVAVLEEEGMCAALLNSADVLVRSAEEGIDLLLKPKRLIATLRG